MAKRKTVTLAGSRSGRVAKDHLDATPERLHHAEASGLSRVDGEGVRRVGDPFDLLHARNLLDRESPERNALLWQAGERLRRHWHAGRLDNLTAFDFTRDSVDVSGHGSATPPTESALRHRQAYRDALAGIGGRLSPYVTGIVVDARTVADLRPLVSDTGHARTADALVVERLREGLHRLCDLWRMQADSRPRRMRTWHENGTNTC